MARPRPAAAVESSGSGRGKAVGLTSILDRGLLFSLQTHTDRTIDMDRTKNEICERSVACEELIPLAVP